MRLRRFFRRQQWDRERSEEIESYLRIETEENVASGMPHDEAHAAALRKLGNRTLIREEIYRMNTITFFDTLIRDMRYALRLLARSPMFTSAALVTLALGIGGNTATFGVIDSILIRPLPYPHAEALIGVWHTANFQGISDGVECTPSMYFTYRDESRTFQHFGVWSSNGARVTG